MKETFTEFPFISTLELTLGNGKLSLLKTGKQINTDTKMMTQLRKTKSTTKSKQHHL